MWEEEEKVSRALFCQITQGKEPVCVLVFFPKYGHPPLVHSDTFLKKRSNAPSPAPGA